MPAREHRPRAISHRANMNGNSAPDIDHSHVRARSDEQFAIDKISDIGDNRWKHVSSAAAWRLLNVEIISRRMISAGVRAHTYIHTYVLIVLPSCAKFFPLRFLYFFNRENHPANSDLLMVGIQSARNISLSLSLPNFDFMYPRAQFIWLYSRTSI